MLRLTSVPIVTGTLLMCLTACERGDQGPPIVVRDSTGIRISENDHEQPAWGADGGWQLAPQPDLQLGNVPMDPDQLLYQAEHSLRLTSGDIAVANTGIGDVRVYDATDGFLVRKLEMPISGDSVLSPRRVYELPGDSLLVYLEDHTLAVFDLAGSMARRTDPILTDLVSDPPPQPAGMLNDGTLILRTYPPQDTTGVDPVQLKVELVRYGTDGTSLGSIGLFEDRTVVPGVGFLVFAPEGQQAVGLSTVWHGPAATFEIRETDMSGAVRQVVRLNRPLGDVLSTDRLAFQKVAQDQLSATVGEEEARSVVNAYTYAEAFPAYSEMVVDRLGNVWVRGYQWFSLWPGVLATPMRWSVFDPEGRFLGDVPIPPIFEIHEIGEDYVLGRMRSTTGREAIYLYEIIKPAPGSPPGER